MTIPVEEDQINTLDCSPGAFIRQLDESGIQMFGIQMVTVPVVFGTRLQNRTKFSSAHGSCSCTEILLPHPSHPRAGGHPCPGKDGGGNGRSFLGRPIWGRTLWKIFPRKPPWWEACNEVSGQIYELRITKVENLSMKNVKSKYLCVVYTWIFLLQRLRQNRRHFACSKQRW